MFINFDDSVCAVLGGILLLLVFRFSVLWYWWVLQWWPSFTESLSHPLAPWTLSLAVSFKVQMLLVPLNIYSAGHSWSALASLGAIRMGSYWVSTVSRCRHVTEMSSFNLTFTKRTGLFLCVNIHLCALGHPHMARKPIKFREQLRAKYRVHRIESWCLGWYC